MHNEILDKKQTELLPLISSFKREFYLVGGTAIALYIGHRRSIDFDLFKVSTINHARILNKINKTSKQYKIIRRVEGQMNLIVNDVKITFFQYPFVIEHKNKFDNIISLPSLLDLAAMKAYALGRRSKWKDYVDLFFLIKNHFSIQEISSRAEVLFGQLFSDKLFRAQIMYFDDIDYTEAVNYLTDAPKDYEIKNYLTEKAVEII